jgi:hypothetical protein
LYFYGEVRYVTEISFGEDGLVPIIAGHFRSITDSFYNIAYFDNQKKQWAPLGSGTMNNGVVTKVIQQNDTLLIGGIFEIESDEGIASNVAIMTGYTNKYVCSVF